MLASKWEGDLTVVEIVTIGVDPIMASQAVLAVRLKVRFHKVGFDLLVA
jgi:hypothetical protein